MTTVTKLSTGECILVVMKDEENEVRVHLHPDDDHGRDWETALVGLVVNSAKLGLLYEEGLCMGGECER